MKNKIFGFVPSVNLVFVDSTVEDSDRLTSSVTSDTEVFVLDPAEDGIAQITAVLKNYSQVSSIHIVSHGSPGHLSLGNAALSLDSLTDYRQDLQQWRSALTTDANLLIYGCNVAAGDRGRTFIEQFQQSVGTAIAASSTLIGNAAQGGNWLLDVAIGEITALLAFSPAAMAAYPASLVNTLVDEDFSDASGSTPPPDWITEVLTGDPAVDQWQFDNPKPRPLPAFFTTPSAIFDSDFLSDNNQKEDVALETPVFDASGESQVFLQFDQKYVGLVDPDYGSEAFVEVFNGTEWKVVADQVDDLTTTTRLDISKEAAGVANAQVRFRYTGNWSQYWAIDNVKVVNVLTPGVTVLGNPQVSEDNVPDTRNFQLVLDSKPTSDVTINFTVDGNQLKSIASLTFTPDNWNVTQTARVDAIADGIAEGDEQTSAIQISASSDDSDYSSLTVKDATASITDHAIPGFLSYRTVEKTYSDLETLTTANPTIASWLDIGDSYDKLTPGGADGYDLHVLELTNKNTQPAGGKPILYVEAGIHSREYSTNEVLTDKRFAEQLVSLTAN